MIRSTRSLTHVLAPLALALASACGGSDEAAPADVADLDTAVDAALDTATATSFDAILFDTAPDDTGGPDVADTATANDADATDGETSGVCDGFGCPCGSNADCLDGYCIEGADGQICTETCVVSCPDGFDCLQSSVGGADPVSLCVPRHPRLCRPCHADSDCQPSGDPFPAYCVAMGDPAEGTFCGSSCATRECPEGYSCETVATMGGGTALQCVPDSGQCQCRPGWDALGFSTTCKVRNAFGACDGTRACGAGGLTACTGPQASPELCDGADNDCNGTPDDIPAVSCLVTNAFGSCPGTTGCVGSQTGCIGVEPAPETCDGADENCNGSTDEGSCDDGLACTDDLCKDGSECTHTLKSGTCMINGACWQQNAMNPLNACEICDPARSTVTWSQTANTCVIGGQCYPNTATNPQNACQYCNANQSTSAWTTASNTCVIGGQCYMPNDVNPASTCQVCVPSTSTTTWTQASNTCNIQGQCYAQGAKKPGESCWVCDPSRSPSGWSAALVNTTCNDGSPCSTDDHCDGAGSCVGNKTCNDGIACTQDTCTANGCDNTQVAAGYCRISGTCWSNQNTNPQNQCQWCASATAPSAWSNKPTTQACSDGNACTLNDFCSGQGTCTSGGQKNCSDGLVCTSDVCNTSTGACTNPGLSSGSCDDSNACTINDTCASGTCAGTAKLDTYDSNASGRNETSATADDLGQELAADFNNMNEFTATLYGSGDIDFYSYRANDNGAGQVIPKPRVELQNIPANQNYQLCVWWDCDDPGDGESADCTSGSAASALDGHPGCCSLSAGSAAETVQFDAGCNNGGFGFDSDVGKVIIKVYNQNSTYVCDGYKLRWGEN